MRVVLIDAYRTIEVTAESVPQLVSFPIDNDFLQFAGPHRAAVFRPASYRPGSVAQRCSQRVHRALEMLAPITRERNPSSHTLMLYGRAQLMTGNAAAAEQTLQQATALLPVSPDAFRYLAAAATSLGHHAIARQAEASLARF